MMQLKSFDVYKQHFTTVITLIANYQAQFASHIKELFGQIVVIKTHIPSASYKIIRLKIYFNIELPATHTH
jgi:hypothetical protein